MKTQEPFSRRAVKRAEPARRITLKRTGIAVAMTVLLVFSASADLFSTYRHLETLETEYFSFIFPAESRTAIEYLAGFADDAYREIAELLGTTTKYRFPVIMTPDSEELNGYFTWVPYLKIVLYQAPTDMNSTLGSFNDDLRKLFYHELTHAVSLTIRSGFENAVAAVFGAPLSASTYLAPLSFVEGVTVSLESRDGAGRAADPLSGAWLRQDIVEGRWKSFTQAAGAWDLHPGRGLYYIYGGYFSRYLQQNYGIEKYAQLWRRFGAASVFKPLDDSILGKGRFSDVYGVSLSDAWSDFKASMTPRVPVFMTTEPLRSLSAITAMTAHGHHVYYVDSNRETVYSYDTESGSEVPLFRAGSEVSRLDMSPDGSRLLISTVRLNAGFPRLQLKTWSLKTMRLEDVPAARIRDAAWQPGGTSMVGIAINGYQTNLIVLDGTTTITLLYGTEDLSYASPVASLDGSTVYALVKEAGKVSVIRLTLNDSPGMLDSVDRLVLPDPLSWIRYLSMGADGILRFSWDDELFYRLVELDGQTLTYQTVPLSGGVHWPVQAGGTTFYIGHFSAGTAPCAFPEDRGQLGFTTGEALWEPAMELARATSIYDAPATRETAQYKALRWLLPKFWLPTARGDTRGLQALGLRLYMEDPAERLTASAGVDWNFSAKAMDFDVVLAGKAFYVPVELSISDSFDTYPDGSTVRTSTASLDMGDTLHPFQGNSVGWNVQAGLAGAAGSSAGTSAYAPWSIAAAIFAAQASLSDFTATRSDKEAQTGYSLTLKAILDARIVPDPEAPATGLEARVAGRIEPGALAFSAYGAVALTSGMAYGPGGRYSSVFYSPMPALYPSWQEFSRGSSGVWYSEAEASLRLLGVELQRGMGMLYANRFSIRTGSRGFLVSGPAWADGVTATGWSLFGRASLTWTPAVGSFARIHPESYLEFWCRPDLATGDYLPHGLSYMLVASY